MSVKRKDITQNSFGFKTIQDEWSDDGKKRELIEVKLFDISPVTFPAYKQTSVKLRFQKMGIPFEDLMLAIDRSEEGVILKRDQELIADTITILNRYIKELEPIEDHSGEPATEGFDPATQIKMRIATMKSKMRGVA